MIQKNKKNKKNNNDDNDNKKKGVKNKLFVAHIGTRPQSYDLSPCLM